MNGLTTLQLSRRKAHELVKQNSEQLLLSPQQDALMNLLIRMATGSSLWELQAGLEARLAEAGAEADARVETCLDVLLAPRNYNVLISNVGANNDDDHLL